MGLDLPALAIELPPLDLNSFFPVVEATQHLPLFIQTSGTFNRKNGEGEWGGFDVFKGKKSLGCSSRATWQQVEGVTAGGKVSSWDVTTQP